MAVLFSSPFGVPLEEVLGHHEFALQDEYLDDRGGDGPVSQVAEILDLMSGHVPEFRHLFVIDSRVK